MGLCDWGSRGRPWNAKDLSGPKAPGQRRGLEAAWLLIFLLKSTLTPSSHLVNHHVDFQLILQQQN